MVVQACHPSPQEGRQKDEEFKASIGYTMRSFSKLIDQLINS